MVKLSQARRLTIPVSDVRLALARKNEEMESGYELCGYYKIGTMEIKYKQLDGDNWLPRVVYSVPLFDKFIQFSPFKDKNGRLLKEGDILQTKSGVTKMVLSLIDGQWLVDVKGDEILLYATGAEQLEYTGSIYVKGE